MKKVYTLMAAAAVSASAFAFNAEPQAMVENANVKRLVGARMVSTPALKIDAPTVSTKDAITAYDIEGIYESEYWGMLSNASGWQTDMFQIIAVSETEFAIPFFSDETAKPIMGTISPDGIITLPSKQTLRQSKQMLTTLYDNFGKFDYEVDEEGYIIKTSIVMSDEPLVAEYDNGFIAFDEDEMIGVEQITNKGASNGYYWLCQSWALWIEVEDIEPEEDYADCGTALLIDGWVNTCYGIDQMDEDFIYEVPVQKNIVEEGVYRLVDPFKGDHPVYLAGYNESEEVGYIKFNIERADFPFIYPGVKSGYADADLGDMYCNELNGYLYMANGNPIEIILEAAATGEAGFTLDDLSSFDEETMTMNIPTAGFGITGQKNKLYTWKDNDGNSVDMTAAIILYNVYDPSGVGSIVTDDKNAPVVYYNIQGMRVENPAHGMYIRVQGNDIKKVIR